MSKHKHDKSKKHNQNHSGGNRPQNTPKRDEHGHFVGSHSKKCGNGMCARNDRNEQAKKNYKDCGDVNIRTMTIDESIEPLKSEVTLMDVINMTIDGIRKAKESYYNGPVYSRNQVKKMIEENTVTTRKAVWHALRNRANTCFAYGFMIGMLITAAIGAGAYVFWLAK